MAYPRAKHEPPHILYFAVVSTAYPRNKRVRAFLEGRLNASLVVHSDRKTGRWLSRLLRTIRDIWYLSADVDAIVLSEFSIRWAPLAFLAARGRKALFVCDGFVGLYETQVEDRRQFPIWHWKARALKILDWLSVRLADYYLTDTDVRREDLLLSHPNAKICVLPVGAPEWARPRCADAADANPGLRPPRILYYGNYVPLHGVETIIAAMSLFEPTDRLVLTLVGNGSLRVSAEGQAHRLGVGRSCTFLDAVTEAELADIIHQHDIVLGVFGKSSKAGRVIPNKVWQGLSCGKVVVTRETPALAEISALLPCGQLRLVPPNDSMALSKELSSITDFRSFNATAHALATYTESEFARFGSALENEFEKRRRRQQVRSG